MWWLVVALLAAQEVDRPKQEVDRPKEVLGLIDQSRALPPEFCADTLLKIAGSPLVSDAKWKRELIEEAFRTAAHAQLPYRRRTGPYTDERSTHEAWTNGIEGLTLQTRAVKRSRRSTLVARGRCSKRSRRSTWGIRDARICSRPMWARTTRRR